jgi:hypothetical protein
MRPNAVTKASPLLWTLYACLTLLALLSGCIPPTSAAETPDYRSTLQPTASPASATPGGEETAAAVELHRLVAESVPAYQPRSATWESTPIAQLGPGSEFLAHDSLHRLPDVNGGWVRHSGVVAEQLADADATWSPTAKHRTPGARDFVYVTNGQHRHTLLRHVRDGEEFAFQGRLFVARRTASSFAVRATGVTPNRVVRTFERHSDELVDVDVILEGEQHSLRLTGTLQHPFYSLDRADYVGMGELLVGERLLTVEGRHARVSARTIRPDSTTVFNFEVEHTHNYFVGDGVGVLVHNSCFQHSPISGGPLPTEISRLFRGGSYVETRLSEPVVLFRVHGGTAGPVGAWWSRQSAAGPLQAQIDLALLPQWGNTAQRVTRIGVPAGTTIFEGFAEAQGGLVGGGSQVLIPNVDPSWVLP